MTLILTKEEPLNLTKNAPLSASLQVGGGWDFKSGVKIDLDLFAYTDTKEICYFGRKEALNGALKCGPDNRDGKGAGIDETIDVDLTKVPANVNKITVALSSYSGQTFDDVQNEFVQIKDLANGEIIAKTQGEITGSGKTLVFIELNRVNNEWVVETKNEMHPHGFQDFAQAQVA